MARFADNNVSQGSNTELSLGLFCVTRSNPTHQLTDPTKPNPLQVEKFGPNPTQPNIANNGAYSLVVTYFYTQNVSVSGTCQIGRKIKFKCLVQPNLTVLQMHKHNPFKFLVLLL